MGILYLLYSSNGFLSIFSPPYLEPSGGTLIPVEVAKFDENRNVLLFINIPPIILCYTIAVLKGQNQSSVQFPPRHGWIWV